MGTVPNDYMNNQKTLFRHQVSGINHASNLNGSAFFWDPGCGKTMASLKLYELHRARIKGLRLLVVCPISLINAAWGAEIKECSPFTYVSLRQSLVKDEDIVIMNYEMLLAERIRNWLASLTGEWMIVLDESSRIKNHAAKTTKALLSLEHKFRIRHICSGTPAPNSELEFWAQMRFISGAVPKSFYAFRNEYFHLERGGVQHSGNGFSSFELSSMFKKGWKYGIMPHKREKMMRLFAPHIHWVKKEDCLDLPPKIEEIVHVELSGKEIAAYHSMRKDLIVEFKDLDIISPNALTKIMKLRQATSGFMYATNDDGGQVNAVFGESKFKVLRELLDDLGPRQVIIWGEFHYEIKKILDMLPGSAALYSETKDRDSEIERFKSKEAQYLIAHPRSAAHGLTFTNCSLMIYFSLNYSFEAHIQAQDRIHRIGQSENCTYYYLIVPGTIDADVLDVLRRKKSLTDAVRNALGRLSHG